MHRFFVNSEEIQDQIIVLRGENYKHIKTVLRLEVNNEITVCDGLGCDYLCRIYNIGSNLLTVEILQKYANAAEPNLKITLFQALPKLDKMDFVIEKAVELGVYCIVPITTERTIVKTNDEREQKKLKRWNTLSEAAAKQSGRGYIPSILNIHNFTNALSYASKLSKSVIAYEKEQSCTLKHSLTNFSGESLGLFIGSEGGFSEDELKKAKKIGVEPITLGKRILRTETAALATISMINYDLEL